VNRPDDLPASMSTPVCRRAYGQPLLVRIPLQTARQHLLFQYGDPQITGTICTGHNHSSTDAGACDAP